MSVSPTHRFLYGESPQSAGKRIWVVYGSHLQDWYFHNQLRGCVGLQRTIELWALEGGKRLTVTLRRDGALDFSGNQDPAAAEQMFSGTLHRRAPRYGSRPGGTTASQSAQENSEAQAQQAATGAQQAAGGSGQALLNTVTRLTQFLGSRNAPGLVIIEDLPHMLEGLSLNQQNATAILNLRSIIQNEWHQHIDPGNLLIFLATDRNHLEEVLPPKLFPKVEWKQTCKPSDSEIGAALDRLVMRHGASVSGGKAIAKILSDQEDTLELAIGKVIDLINKGERDITAGRILDIPPINESKVLEVKDELNKMVGLLELKQKVENIERKAREIRKGLLDGSSLPLDESMHLVFSGPPGTGKTTAARIVSNLFHALGLLKKTEPKEVIAGEILSSNREESGENMRRIIQEARGGLLFIDEAHQLGDKNSMGAPEAISVLVPASLNLRRELVIIIAGYHDKMHDFFNMDQGLPRRFPDHGRILFRDYSPDELWEIFIREVRKRGFMLETSIESRARNLLTKRSRRASFGNAGGVGNLVDEILERHSAQNKIITVEDMPPLVKRDPRMLDEAFLKLTGMLGIAPVRNQINLMMESIKYDLDEEEAGTGIGEVSLHPGNMRFVGPPGTGKTTVARLLATLLCGIGCIEKPVCVEMSPGSLRGLYQGWTGDIVRRKIEEARDGVFFIDEAYGLVKGDNDSYGQEAVDELVQQISRPENMGTVFVIAGYKNRIDQFLTTNEGLARRFGVEVEFPNFSPDDCVEHAKNVMRRGGYEWDDAVPIRIRETALTEIQTSGDNFGNAGWIEKVLVPSYLANMKSRVNTQLAPGDPDRRKIILTDLSNGIRNPSVGAEQATSTESASYNLLPWVPHPQYVQLSAEVGGGVAEQDIVRNLEASSFQIITDGSDGRGSATGFFVTPDGLMATCAHVVWAAKTISVLCGKDRNPRYAHVVKIDEDLDLALIAVDSSPPVRCLTLGNSMSLLPLAGLIVFGNAHVHPRDPGRMVTARVVRNDPNNPRAFESDGAIEKGFSGGPALDAVTGAVLGIVSGGYGVSATELIRVDQLCFLLEDLGYTFVEFNCIEEESNGNPGN